MFSTAVQKCYRTMSCTYRAICAWRDITTRYALHSEERYYDEESYLSSRWITTAQRCGSQENFLDVFSSPREIPLICTYEPNSPLSHWATVLAFLCELGKGVKKDTQRVVLLLSLDVEYRFLFVDIGRNSRIHDASVFDESSFVAYIYSETLNLPLLSPLLGYNTPLPYVIVADDAFLLKVNIMKLYPGRDLTFQKKSFNYRLNRAHRIMENAFGILVTKFRILINVIPLSVGKSKINNLYMLCAP